MKSSLSPSRLSTLSTQISKSDQAEEPRVIFEAIPRCQFTASLFAGWPAALLQQTKVLTADELKVTNNI